nr:MAG TPA: hypothetical protein [Caudoviricetes sp.]
MYWKTRSRDEILENLKQFGNANERKLGLYGDEYLCIDGSEIPESVNYLQVEGFGNARFEILGWGGELELLGTLKAKVFNVDRVEINTVRGVVSTCEDCNQVRTWGRSTTRLTGCKSVELYESSSTELWNCPSVEAYDCVRFQACKDSRAMLFDRADGNFYDNSSGVLLDASRAIVYKDSRVNAVSDLSVVQHESGAVVHGNGRIQCFGSNEEKGGLFTATRGFLNRLAIPLNSFETEYLVYKTTSVDGLTGQLYDEPTKWEVGKTVSIPEEKRTTLNRGLFFTPTLAHAISQGREYERSFRVFRVRIRIEDVKLTNIFGPMYRNEVEAWEGEVIDEVKNPFDVLFDMV